MKRYEEYIFQYYSRPEFLFDLKDGLLVEKEARISILNLLMKFIFVRVRLILNNRMLWWEEKFF